MIEQQSLPIGVLNKSGQTAEIDQYAEKINNRFTTYHIVGENAGLRKVNIRSHKDIDNMWDIETSEGMKKEVNENVDDVCQNKKELKDWIEEKSYDSEDDQERRKNSYVNLFAITKNEAHPSKSYRHRSQAVEGWIRVDGSSSEAGDNEERHRYERIIGTTLPRSKHYPSPVELSYIRKPNGEPHLMASAVRQICHMIAAQDGEVNRSFFDEQDGKVTPKRIIMAFIRPGNENSRKVLEEAGFILGKSGVSWKEGDDPKKKTDMYVLDWNEFHKKMETNAQDHLLKRIEAKLPQYSGLQVIDQIDYPGPKKNRA